METGQGIATSHSFSARFTHFVEELARRRVWRTALAYGAVVFVLLQLGEIVFPAFGAPHWALRALVISSFLGFPVALCCAWVFDITPRGIKKTLGVSYSDGGFLSSGRTLPRFALLAVTFATVGGVGWWTLRDTVGQQVSAMEPTAGPVLPAAAPGESSTRVTSLAVLPLDDFSEEEGGEYFTAGLHEELVSQLSQADLARVVSRTTVVQYDRSRKTMPAIAQDLGVEGVLEGSVFRAGNRVRITVQLIHGPSDTHLWADSYEGTLDDPIALQREVAEAVAEGIRNELLPEDPDTSEPVRLAKTDQIPEEYLKGRREESKGTPEALASAARHYRRVLEEDSAFLPARAGLETVRRRVDRGLESPTDQSPEVRIAGARRLATASHYQEAEGILRGVIHEVEAPEEAWRALEQIKAIQGDFEGVVEIRMEQLAHGLIDSRDSVSLVELKSLLQKDGDEGFWVWKVGELEGRVEAGEEVSPVELARACVGVGDFEAAFPYLETALEEGDRNLVTLWTDPAWDTLRPDPRFRQILTQVRRSKIGKGFPIPDRPWPIP
jgi:TolB-like protein